MPLRPGTRVDRYVIESAIGSGSMGDVYGAVDEDLGRPVAIKILGEKHLHNPELEGRFIREARSAAAISHRNVVQVYSTGTFEERPYIAMELLRGKDLQTIVETTGPLDFGDAAKCAAEAGRGLQAAAKAALIHRDVKPSNLVRLEDGTVKVTDFGLAKPLAEDGTPALTAHGVVVGTPDYIAPEQARGQELDERCDIYALGGTLYYLCTGSPPYRRGTQSKDRYLKVVARHLREPPPDPRQRRGDIPTSLADLVVEMMSKEPKDRPSYDQLIARLESIASVGTRSVSHKLPSQPAPTPFVGAKREDVLRGIVPEQAPLNRTLLVTPTPAIAAIRESQIQQAVSREAALAADDDAAATIIDAPTPNPDAPVEPFAPTADVVTTTRPSSSSDTSRVGLLRRSRAQAPAAPAPRRRSGFVFVLATSILAILVLGIGWSVRHGRRPAAGGDGLASDAAVALTSANGRLAEPSIVDASPPLQVPEGMSAVAGEGGARRWLIAREPVTRGAFLSKFPDLVVGDGDEAAAVSRVTRSEAAAYAKELGGRLATAEEIEASRRSSAIAPSGLWEWTADTEEGQPIAVNAQGERERRKNRGYGDVTFRVIRDVQSAGPAREPSE